MAKFCTNCGSEVDRSTKTCMSCGAVVNGTATAGSTIKNNTYSNTNSGATQVGKSRKLVIIFALVFGHLGIHNFYLGYTNKGIAKLLISILSCGMFSWLMWIYALVEMLMIVKNKNSVDAFGNPLVD